MPGAQEQGIDLTDSIRRIGDGNVLLPLTPSGAFALTEMKSLGDAVRMLEGIATRRYCTYRAFQIQTLQKKHTHFSCCPHVNTSTCFIITTWVLQRIYAKFFQCVNTRISANVYLL